MPCRWYIDECSPHRIAGWIDDDGPVDSIEIAVNGRPVAAFAPVEYRKDLEDAGFGDGRRSFAFAPSPYLIEPANLVTISRGRQVLHSQTLPPAASDGAATTADIAPRPARRRGGGSTGGLLHGGRRTYKDVASAEGCEFYHVVDLPDGTTTRGQWDLRRGADAYLGNVDFAGKRVIEIGPASGFLSFHMERRGARVAAIEPPMDSFWDLVPQASASLAEIRGVFGAHIQRIRDSFWFLHRCYGSEVECYEADAYGLPPQPIEFDIGLLASVLLHVSSPVRMLQSVAGAVAGQIVIVERFFPELAAQPVCRLVPSAANRTLETWWEFSPAFFEQYLAVLGFPHSRVTRHRQLFATIGEEWDMFTLVASR